jgi:MFS family permease
MIAGTYLISAGLTALLAIFLIASGLTQYSFIGLVCLTFFFASAGASAAYLTVSEIFPMETRALAIAFFYALGTGLGGIIGPLLFGRLIASGRASTVAIGFVIGAVVMALGGLAELLFGVHAERMPLETIAKPLTETDVEQAPAAQVAQPDVRLQQRAERIQQRERSLPRRFVPGPGSTLYSPGMVGTAIGSPPPAVDPYLDEEIETIARTLTSRGPMDRDQLDDAVGGRYWDPLHARFRAALREAVDEGRVRRLSHETYAAADGARTSGGGG